MASKQPINITASVKAKLLNIARENGIDYQSVFKQFVHERLLYRLSLSKYKSNFILKGALLFLAFDISRYRPTKDIDLLSKDLSNDLDIIKDAFKEITSVKFNDGLVFITDNIIVERISEEDKYQGIRVKFGVFLENAKDRVQVDIGFGDKVYKEPIEIDYPILLEYPAPNIYAYSIESAIAEKFEAIVSLGITTSRMKDFYDIWFFANKMSFTSFQLKEALQLTFGNRETDLDSRESIFSESFKNDKQKEIQWKSFMKTSKLNLEKDFTEIVDYLEKFLNQMFLLEENKTWNPKLGDGTNV